MCRICKSTVVILSMLVVCVTAVQSGERTFDKTFSVGTGGSLRVETDCSSIEIVGVEGSNDVSVHALLKGHQRDLDEFEITASRNGEHIEIVGKSLRARRWWMFGGDDLNVTFSVKVPKTFSVTTYTAGGDIVLRDVKGSINGKTSGGDLKLSNVSGPVALHTSGGTITANHLDGTIHLETSGGDIRVSDVKGDVKVNTSGGDIRLRAIEGRVSASTSGGDVMVQVPRGYRGIHVETSGGDIDIVVPRELSATIDAQTSGGEVSSDLPITTTGRRSDGCMRGTVNGGGETLVARTSGGDIRIRAAAETQ